MAFLFQILASGSYSATYHFSSHRLASFSRRGEIDAGAEARVGHYTARLGALPLISFSGWRRFFYAFSTARVAVAPQPLISRLSPSAVARPGGRRLILGVAGAHLRYAYSARDSLCATSMRIYGPSIQVAVSSPYSERGHARSRGLLQWPLSRFHFISTAPGTLGACRSLAGGSRFDYMARCARFCTRWREAG